MGDIRLVWGGNSAVFDLDDLTFAEAEAIERAHGGPLKSFREALSEGFVSAKRIAFWHAHHRLNPDLRLTDFDDVNLSEVTVEVDEVADPPVPGGGPDEEKP